MKVGYMVEEFGREKIIEVIKEILEKLNQNKDE